jgi:hypothetical protein
VPSPVFQVIVVVPGPSPVVTGFGDAAIVAAGAAGLAADEFASGFFDGPHAAKKNNGRRIPIVGMNRFIKDTLLMVFLERLAFVKSRRQASLQDAFFQKLLGSALLTLWLSYVSPPACPL